MPIQTIPVLALYLIRSATVRAVQYLSSRLASVLVSSSVKGVKEMLTTHSTILSGPGFTLSSMQTAIREEAITVIRNEAINILSNANQSLENKLNELRPLAHANFFRLTFLATGNWLIDNGRVQNGDAELLRLLMNHVSSTHDIHALAVLKAAAESTASYAKTESQIHYFSIMQEAFADSVQSSLHNAAKDVTRDALAKIIPLLVPTKLGSINSSFVKAFVDNGADLFRPFVQMFVPLAQSIREGNYPEIGYTLFDEITSLDRDNIFAVLIEEAALVDSRLVAALHGPKVLAREERAGSLNACSDQHVFFDIINRLERTLASHVHVTSNFRLTSAPLVPRPFLTLAGANQTPYAKLIPASIPLWNGRKWIPKRLSNLLEDIYFETNYVNDLAIETKRNLEKEKLKFEQKKKNDPRSQQI